MNLSSFYIVPSTIRRRVSHKMYIFSRSASYARLFILLSFCGLMMYVALAFYTFQVAFLSMNSAERTEQRLQNNPDAYLKRDHGKSLKYILLWSTPEFKHNFTGSGQETFINNNCDNVNCFLTINKTLLNGDVTKFDAIVFSISTLRRWKRYLPQKRSPKQKYVFYSLIPANDNYVCNVMADNYFNWTWTYKLYSDIATPFIEVKNKTGNIVAPSIDIEWPTDMVLTHESTNKNKSKALMWYNENCDSIKSKAYANELKIHMKEHSMEFDIYGCGHKECPNGTCVEAIEKNYYFYLAFEDSISDDYVTKEVLKGYHHNAVPVVIGGADYTKFLPPGSYFDARYETPERLAGLLEYIYRSPHIYNRFFNWKNHFTIHEADPRQGYCQLCALLNDKKRTESHTAYETFRKWWYDGNLHDKCYPKGVETYDGLLSYIDNAELRKNYMP